MVVHARSAAVAIGSAVIAATIAISLALPAQAASSARWHIVHRFEPRHEYSAYRSVAVSGSHAWAVGGTGVAANGLPIAAYFSNGRWSASKVPGIAAYIGTIMAVSADAPGDAWAVSPGAVLHWHGGRWRIAKKWNLSGGPPGPYKSGITAISPTNVWVFGGGSFGNGTWHLNGRHWTKITGPGRSIFAASAASPRDMWAIGGTKFTTLLHYYHGAWHTVTSPALSGLNFGSVFASSATSVWLTASPVGKTGLLLLHHSGTRWTTYAIPSALPLSAVAADGLPFGGLSPDGHGGFWLSAFSSGTNWLLDRSSAGHWSRIRMGTDVVWSLARIRATATLWATGSTRQGHSQNQYTNAVIWAYSPAR
jgi:hypothetical protein